MKLGPTLSEMREPWTIDADVRRAALNAKDRDPLDPLNLYNITWYGADDEIRYFVVPPEVTGVDARIVVIYSRDFPTGSHKVGAAYSVLAELIVEGTVDPKKHRLVWPSTGNFCRGGAYDCALLGCTAPIGFILLLLGFNSIKNTCMDIATAKAGA